MVIETRTEQSIVVGMGELQVSRCPDAVLSCIGLGSCVAICAYDRVHKVGALVHVVLPRSDGRDGDSPAKYGDTAFPYLLKEIYAQGGARSSLVVKLAGGAQMSLAPGLNNTFKTGERNLAEVMLSLAKEGMHPAGADTGGTIGRTIRLYLDTGRVTVRTVGGEEREI